MKTKTPVPAEKAIKVPLDDVEIPRPLPNGPVTQ